MPKFVLAGTDFAVNLDYIVDVQISGTDVQLAYGYPGAAPGHFTISCTDLAEAQKVFVAVTQPFDPKAT